MPMAIMMDGRDAARGSRLKGARDAEELARAFRQARQHSLVVKVLRVAMPLIAVIVTGYYALTLGVTALVGQGCHSGVSLS